MENMENTALDNDPELRPEEVHLFYDTIERISNAIPETFDLGTIPVELTCIVSSPSYFILGAGCGTLFVYNKKLGRLARPLRTNSFEVVTCIHHVSCLDDFIAIGHNTGTLIVMRLPSGREGGCTALSQCIDMDSHRRSPITCVAVSSDAGKVLSGDASGTVILSTVIFDTGEFCHSFLFEGASSIAALEFFDESAVVDNGLQLTVIGIASCSASRILNSRTERAIVIGIHCTDSFVYLVEKSKICKYSRSLLDFTVIPADEVVGESCGITSAEWSSDGTKLAALSSCIVFVMYDLIHSQVLWRATLSNHLRSFVVDFCIDTDDSIYYITRHRGVHRVGISSVPKSLAEKESESAIASLLSSPKKLLADSASRVTNKGFSFLNNAINVAKDISVNSEVATLLEDALKAIDSRNNVPSVEEVPIAVGTAEQEIPFNTVTDAHVDVNDDRIIEEHHDIFISRKERVRSKKAGHTGRVNSYDIPNNNDPEAVDEGSIMALRREVLGSSIFGCSPCSSGVSIESPPVWSPNESPLVCGHLPGSSVDPKNSSPCSSRDTSTSGRRRNSISGDDDDISKSSDVQYLSHDLQSLKQPLLETPKAESATLAYEYLLLKSSANPGPSETRLSTSTAEREVQRNKVLFKRSQKSTTLNDQIDIWIKVILPYTVKSFTVGCKHIVICHRRKTARISKHDDIGSKKHPWMPAKWMSDDISMNDDESIIWRVYREVGWCAVDGLSPTTHFEQCATDGGGVTEVSVAGNVAWYLTKEAVSLQMELPEKAIFSRVDRDWSLRSITVSDEAVWAIRNDVGSLVVRVGLARCKMGLDWIEIIPEGPSKLVSVCVYRSYGFALDDAGQLWMSTGLDQHHPYGSSDAFYKVCLPAFDTKAAPTSTWSVRVASTGLYICTGKMMYVARSAVSGHKFPREVPSKFELLDNFSLISAGSFANASGYVHLCRQDSEIFVYRPERHNFVTIALPSTSHAVLSIAGIPDKLSLIDSSGRVFHSDGETSNWKAETSFPDAVCSIAHSKISSWAVTCTGKILVLSHGTNEWISVLIPCDTSSNIVPTQVFASPNGIYVWVVAGGRAWARTSINERNPAGAKWMETYHTCDLSSLAVGDSVVWALDCYGQLLRLRGLAAGNPAGNYWRPISQASFRAISVDAQSELWAIDMENRLVRHLSDVYVPEKFTPIDAPNPFELV